MAIVWLSDKPRVFECCWIGLIQGLCCWSFALHSHTSDKIINIEIPFCLTSKMTQNPLWLDWRAADRTHTALKRTAGLCVCVCGWWSRGKIHFSNNKNIQAEWEHQIHSRPQSRCSRSIESYIIFFSPVSLPFSPLSCSMCCLSRHHFCWGCTIRSHFYALIMNEQHCGVFVVPYTWNMEHGLVKYTPTPSQSTPRKGPFLMNSLWLYYSSRFPIFFFLFVCSFVCFRLGLHDGEHSLFFE